MIFLKVNGHERSVPADRAARPLLEVLRDDLDLPGTKYGCGVGACGACTVLLEGHPLSSCLLLCAQAAGRDVLTIEGLAPRPGALHAVQQAFVDHGAFQCAYCTPGFVLSTLALLRENPSPSEDEARAYLAGNLCRCGSYQNILRAVLSLRGKRLG